MHSSFIPYFLSMFHRASLLTREYVFVMSKCVAIGVQGSVLSLLLTYSPVSPCNLAYICAAFVVDLPIQKTILILIEHSYSFCPYSYSSCHNSHQYPTCTFLNRGTSKPVFHQCFPLNFVFRGQSDRLVGDKDDNEFQVSCFRRVISAKLTLLHLSLHLMRKNSAYVHKFKKRGTY